MNFRQLLAAKSKERRKYTEAQIAALKADLAAGMGRKAAGKKHGVSPYIVRDVIDRLSWRDVEAKGQE